MITTHIGHKAARAAFDAVGDKSALLRQTNPIEFTLFTPASAAIGHPSGQPTAAK